MLTQTWLVQTQPLVIRTIPLETLKKFVSKNEYLKQMKVSVPVRWTHSEEHWGRIFIELVTHVTLATTDYSLSPEQTQLCAVNRLLYNMQWHLCLIDECLCYVRLPASCNSLGYTPGPAHICLTNITYISQSGKPVLN